MPFKPAQKVIELNWNSKITMLDSNHFVVNCSNYGFYMFVINRQTGNINCNPQKFLSSEEINCIFSDKDKRLWIGTPNGLLRQKLKGSFLSLYTIAPTSKKMQYAESLTCAYRYKNKLYAGHYSRNTGLTVLDATTMKIEKHISFYGQENSWNEVQSVQMYYADTLWLGTNAGLLWFDTKSEHYGDAMKQIKNTQPEVINKIFPKPSVATNINLAPVGKDGYAWMVYGLRGIVARYDPALRQITFFTADTKPALPFNRVKAIVYDSYGDVWLSGHSLARWNSRGQFFDTLINVYGGARKFNANIIAIAADDSGSLWLHNEENGLLQYQVKEKKFTAYNTNDGFPSNVFESFSPLVNGSLWMAGSTNLTGFDTRTKKTIVYNYDDGLSANLPTSRKIGYDSASRSFYLCCENDLLVFRPGNTEDNYASSGLLIEQLVFNDGRSIPQPQDGMRINPDSNNFSIHFTIVDYEAGGSYRFAYRLGAENTWTDLAQQRSLNLNGLQPGNYRLAIRAAAKSGGRNIKEFYFIIEPHYWQTAWFALLLALFVLVGLYFFLRARIRHVRQKANIDKQLAQMEMKALHAQMNPHFIFNSLNSIKEMVMNNENNEASGYLTKFAQMIRITLDQSAHTFVTLRSTADYLHRYIEMEKIRNSHFYCSIMVDESLDQDETELPPMLIQPFIENAIWHGVIPPHKTIHINVSFRRAGTQLICIVEDDGIGIDKSLANKQGRTLAVHSYGIANVQDRVRLLNEKYNLASKVGIADKSRMSDLATGTIVTIELPLQIFHP
ncbi:MAG: histidine kinase [Bacteroidota bacterium]